MRPQTPLHFIEMIRQQGVVFLIVEIKLWLKVCEGKVSVSGWVLLIVEFKPWSES